jgi:hypothetical protein
MNYRNNGSTAFTVSGIVSDGASLTNVFIPETKITSGASAPQWIYLGSVTKEPGSALVMKLYVTASNTAATLDVNTIAAMGLDNPETDRAMLINYITAPVPAVDFEAGGILYIDPRLFSRTSPRVYIDSDLIELSALGDPRLFINNAATASVWLATNPTSGYWVATSFEGTAASVRYYGEQFISALIPE